MTISKATPLVLAASILAVLAALFVLPACAGQTGWGRFDEPSSSSGSGADGERGAAGDTSAAPAPPPEPDAGAEMRRTARRVLRPVIWIAGVSAVLSLLLRFTPIGGLFGGRATAGAVAAFVGGLALLYAVERHGVLFAEAAIWGSVALGAAAAVPWLIAFYRRNAARAKAATGVRLAMTGHADAGVAFLADANPTLLDKAKRKELVSKLIDTGDLAADGEDRERRIRGLLAAFGVKVPNLKRGKGGGS